jgi:hypothetical protein
MMMRVPDADTLPFDDVVRRICNLNEGIREFWSESHGWAPAEASTLLARSRLDRQVALSHCLTLWTPESHPQERQEGALILGWANLGALVEGTLKWFLSVYLADYQEDRILRHRKAVEPEAAMLDELRGFFANHVWTDNEKQEWDPWLAEIRDRRNALHAFKEREIGSFVDLHRGVRRYLELIRTLDGRVPYPDEVYGPQESADGC